MVSMGQVGLSKVPAAGSLSQLHGVSDLHIHFADFGRGTWPAFVT